MSRKIKSGLIQMSLPKTEGEGTIPEIIDAMVQKHIPYIEKAGQQGVQILCLQEIFNTPYFCPGQDRKWYESAESVPGPTTELMAKYAKKYNMVIIVPIYEKEQAGVLYNTAAVIDADGTYLGKYRKNHIPHTSGFWEKFFFKPGNLGYPVFQTKYAKVGVYICYDRHFPDGARCLGSQRGGDRVQPQRHRGRIERVPLEVGTTRARCGQRLLHGLHQPRRRGEALEPRQVLWPVLLRGSAWADLRTSIARQ